MQPKRAYQGLDVPYCSDGMCIHEKSYIGPLGTEAAHATALQDGG